MMRIVTLLLVLSFAATARAAETDQQGLDFFEAKIRPMLVAHCYECHSAEAAAKSNLKAGLLLDTREGSRMGGESGPAVVPNNVEESLLIEALRHESFEMPPNGKLPDEVIADFVKWIEMGAPDPRDGEAVVAETEIDIAAGKEHWAFTPLSKPESPTIADDAWTRTEIDRFIRARQEAAGVTPNDIAEPRTLIRRAYFALIGLPPQPERVEQFIGEFEQDADAAFGRLIDELLASEHYGERWARHWLDLARFAESNGYAFDGDRPNAWHYRDFVIQALNADLPYDEFVRLQIAGDLMTDVNVQTTAEAQEAVRTIAATGFLTAGPFTTQQTQKERERSRYEQLDDIISTMGTSLLGLTVGCSRCHSHKYDPLPQYDYYRLAACFAEVGFSDTGINMQPEEFKAQMDAYNAAHAPLVAARTQFEQEQLPARYDQWLAGLADSPSATVAAPTIGEWHHAGPFPAESFDAAFEKAFPPEEGVDLAATYLEGQVAWAARPEWTDGTVHNTLTGDNSANYLYRVVESAEEEQLSLSLGSDDSIKVWLNGTEVLAKHIGRGAAAGQESVAVSLQKGRNELLIKIVNAGGPSGFYFAATQVTPLELESAGVWHHVGPFAAASFDVAFDQVFAPERGIDLAATFEEGKLKWTEQPEWTDGEPHNDKLAGANSANYLYRVIESARPQVVDLSLGSDDGIKLWVNGREVLSNKVGRNVAAAGQESVQIQLAAGRNDLLMKIVNGGGATGFYYAAAAAQPAPEIAAILNTPQAERNDEQKQKLVDWYKGFDLDWLALNRAVVVHELETPQPELTNVFAARVRGTTYQFGDDTYKVYHLRRGNADNKEDQASPGFLQVLMRTDDLETHWLNESEQQETPRAGRLGLADWLTDVDDGAGHLLARVIVNRLWHHHFGRGIVATPSDFGTRGERPSHPELLDWLASELVAGGWRLKPIHRLIMTSAVYMQAGEVSESGRQVDPENLLLWRRDARRLEAEIVRDSLLSVSGTLDETMFGKGTLDPNSTRRSIYFTVKRSQLIPFLQLFDAPDTMQGVGTREQSTVAPQALALLNSPLVRDLATKFAARVRPDANTSIDEAIDRAYQVALARPATQSEVATMRTFIEQQTAMRGDDPNAETLAVRDFCHLLMCMNEFVYVD